MAAIPTRTDVDPATGEHGASARRNARESRRAWPRYAPASTHFELGEGSEDRSTGVIARRYTPRYGVRKD
jgi:hypothetical protein